MTARTPPAAPGRLRGPAPRLAAPGARRGRPDLHVPDVATLRRVWRAGSLPADIDLAELRGCLARAAWLYEQHARRAARWRAEVKALQRVDTYARRILAALDVVSPEAFCGRRDAGADRRNALALEAALAGGITAAEFKRRFGGTMRPGDVIAEELAGIRWHAERIRMQAPNCARSLDDEAGLVRRTHRTGAVCILVGGCLPLTFELLSGSRPEGGNAAARRRNRFIAAACSAFGLDRPSGDLIDEHRRRFLQAPVDEIDAVFLVVPDGSARRKTASAVRLRLYDERARAAPAAGRRSRKAGTARKK